MPSKNEASWLYSITKNETLNYIKKQKDTISLDDIYYITVEDKELNKIIDKDSYNKILGNLSFKEIAQILDEPVGTIKWKYYKSIHTLKILLSNLSMFIVTLFVGLKTMFNTNKSDQPNIAEQEENIREDSITIQDEITQTESESQDRTENNIIAEDSTKGETKEEIIIILNIIFTAFLNKSEHITISYNSIFYIISVIAYIYFNQFN